MRLVLQGVRQGVPLMMTVEQLVVLAIIQGITEFLPVSSSAHLILLPELMDLPDQGALIDVSIHVGSLFAVIIYFWRDVLAVIRGVWLFVRGQTTEETKLFGHIAVATLPVVIAGGALFYSGLIDQLRDPEIIAWATIIFGIALYGADRFGSQNSQVADLSTGNALVIGLAQCLSLVPGTSRSGITMTAARALGYSRVESARFSMLMAVPTITAFGMAAGLEIAETGDRIFQQDALIAVGLSFVSALITIAFFMRLLTRITLTPFVIYRLGLGAALLLYVYAG